MEAAMGNPFVHIELNTTDPAKAKTFYGSLFDWKLEDTDMGGGMIYTMIKVGEGTGGGLMKHPMPGAPSIWIPYILVSDVAASTKKAKAAGGTIIKDVSEVPNMGSFSIVQDPTGGVIGLWQEKMK
jgi:predicted enzyme related to lactoylglutathione lyase